jgi:hypothetical protein
MRETGCSRRRVGSLSWVWVHKVVETRTMRSIYDLLCTHSAMPPSTNAMPIQVSALVSARSQRCPGQRTSTDDLLLRPPFAKNGEHER